MPNGADEPAVPVAKLLDLRSTINDSEHDVSTWERVALEEKATLVCGTATVFWPNDIDYNSDPCSLLLWAPAR